MLEPVYLLMEAANLIVPKQSSGRIFSLLLQICELLSVFVHCEHIGVDEISIVLRNRQVIVLVYLVYIDIQLVPS